jgi:hypothetical protein
MSDLSWQADIVDGTPGFRNRCEVADNGLPSSARG